MKMKQTDVSTMRLRSTVEQMPDTFRTKQVSTHPDVTRALARFTDDPRFHQFIGSALSAKASQIGIACINPHPNATWCKINTADSCPPR